LFGSFRFSTFFTFAVPIGLNSKFTTFLRGKKKHFYTPKMISTYEGRFEGFTNVPSNGFRTCS
ncbi:MAG: hypothetical protein KAR20_19525, partial [Candidatus Heimdallarchaeota archaeon]|nr:hypothetical protein [Candidatus Heimdallarchaeota archaeon]